MRRKSGRFNRAHFATQDLSFRAFNSPESDTPHRLETLEQRMLLSASAISTEWFANISEPATSGGSSTIVDNTANSRKVRRARRGKAATPTIVFQGKEYAAAANQLIVKLTNSAANAAGNVFGVANVLDLASSGARVLKGLGMKGMVLIETDDGQMDAVADKLIESGDIEYLSVNQIITKNAIPNDPKFAKQRHHNNAGKGRRSASNGGDIRSEMAWNLQTGNFGVVGAVIDSGVDYNHEDLFQNIWVNPGEIPGNSIDDDGNGFIDDIFGWDFADNDSDPMDEDGHGTHVAGTMAAAGNNGIGVSGVAQQGQIMVLKIFGEFGDDFQDAAIQAINYATMMRSDYGVNVVVSNNSYGELGIISEALEEAITAHAQAGISFVGAVGNDSTNVDFFPDIPTGADVDSIIAVGASNFKDNMPYWSNFGQNSVDLVAPGVKILSTLPGNKYGYMTGTSMAAPQVAGAVMLLAADNPGITPTQAKRAIMNSVDLVNDLHFKTASGGRLNVYEALMFGRGQQTADAYESNDGAAQASASTADKRNKRRNNRRGPARILAVAGGSDLGTIDGPRTLYTTNLVDGSEDWYRFEMQDFGDDADFVMLHDYFEEDGELLLELFAEDSTTLLETGEVTEGAGGEPDENTISLDGYEPGVYFVRVSQVGGDASPHYNLTVSPAVQVEDAYETNNNGPSVLDLPAGVPFSSNLGIVEGTKKIANLNTLDGSQDVYRFELLAPATSNKQVVKINFDPKLGDLDLLLFTEEGYLNLEPPIAFSFTWRKSEELIYLNGADAGAYIIVVDNFGGSLNPNYRLTVVGGRLPRDRVGNNFNKAKTIPRIILPFEFSDYVGVSDEEDYFKFQVGNDGAAVLLSLTELTGNADLELLDKQGNVIFGSFNPGTDDEVITPLGPIPLERGVYFIRVSAAFGASAFYTLQTAGIPLFDGPNNVIL